MDVAELSGVPDWLPDHLREDGIEELYPPQAAAVEAGATDGDSLVASVPTASGKTLIAELAMLSSVERGGKALYIVPLRALASEKRAEFEEFEQYGVSVGVSTGNYESSGEWLATRDIVVATSEKVDSLVRNGAPWIDDLTCVVADEVHLVDDGQRGPTLEVTLAKLRQRNPDLQTVALSATVGNADELADWLDAELVDSEWRPIDLKTGVHYGQAVQYGDGSQQQLSVRGNEKQTAAIVRDTLEDEGSTLVFVNSRRNAESAARRLANTVESHLTRDERDRLREVAGEIRDVSDTETSDDLADAVERGAAFHHAGLCVTGETQILRPDGTFERIKTIVEDSEQPGKAVGMDGMHLQSTNITDTFQMDERPVLSVRTRTGNELRLSRSHPLPVLGDDGVEWKPAGEISAGEYVARPRHVETNVKEAPSFRELIPDAYRVYQEYEVVGELAESVGESTLPATFRNSYARDRNITVGDFRAICDESGHSIVDHMEQVISDGGQKPITVPRHVNDDICWLAGVVSGDGYVTGQKVTLTGRSSLLSEFDRIVDEQFDRTTYSNESPSGTPYCTLNSKLVADVLSEHFGIPRGEGEISLPKIPLSDELFGAFVAGLFDADGSVSPRLNADGAPRIEFYSTSSAITTQLKTALLRFGIVAYRDKRDTEGRVTEHDGREIRTLNDVHRVTIYGVGQLRRFESEIGFRHRGKAEKLRAAIEKNPDVERRQNDVIPPSIGSHVRTVRESEGQSMNDLEPEVSKATLSRFERGLTPMKRATFQSLASQLDDEILNVIAESDVFWDRVESVEQVGSEPLYDLTTESANFVANGIIAHNTSDHRELVEEAFRDRLLKVVCATPTLAAGVNTPSRRVVVRDWRRYSGEAGGMQPLSVLEVHQMFGRAGRPGLDPYGEALLLAKTHDELDELFERYIWADPEPVRSKLAAEPAMRTHILATVASGFARSRSELLEFLDETLYATQTDERGRLEQVTDDMLAYLEANDFLERGGHGPDSEGDELEATNLGHTVSRLYLDPMSAAEIIDGLEDASDPTALGLYHLVSRTPDMYQLYLRSGDEEEYTMLAYERETEFLGAMPSEFEESRWEDWLSALKTARLLEDWASEVDEDRITDRYGVGPGDIRGKVDTAEWLLGAAESLAGELGLDCTPAVQRARKRVEHGVRDELVNLAGVRGVGRKRARRLFAAGIESRAELREADKSVVLSALRGKRTAENVLENAGREDPSMDGVDPDGSVTVDTGDEEGQASLGDF